MEKTNSFESLVFKRFVIPGIIIEVLLALYTLGMGNPMLPTGLNLSLLSRPIGGPPAIAMQAGMIPCVILMLAFLSVSWIYTVVFLYKYYKESSTFLNSIRRFLIFGLLVLLILDLLALSGWIEFIRWEYVHIMNLPVVITLTSLVYIMTGVFLYWTIRTYRNQEVKFFSLKTLEGVALFVVSLVLIIGALLLLV